MSGTHSAAQAVLRLRATFMPPSFWLIEVIYIAVTHHAYFVRKVLEFSNGSLYIKMKHFLMSFGTNL